MTTLKDRFYNHAEIHSFSLLVRKKNRKKWMLYCYSCCEYCDFLICFVYVDSLHNLAFDGVKYALNTQQPKDELLFILCK